MNFILDHYLLVCAILAVLGLAVCAGLAFAGVYGIVVAFRWASSLGGARAHLLAVLASLGIGIFWVASLALCYLTICMVFFVLMPN